MTQGPFVAFGLQFKNDTNLKHPAEVLDPDGDFLFVIRVK